MSHDDVSPPLYGGSAAHYARGRLPYPADLVPEVERACHLNGEGRAVDLGCGPGTLTLPLARLFSEIIGVDADEAMVAEGWRRVAATGATNVRFLSGTPESLLPDLGPVRAVILGMSFHWMDGPLVARCIREVLEPGGTCLFVYGWTLRGDVVPNSPHPLPPYDSMADLMREYAGNRVSPSVKPGDEGAPMARAGFAGPEALHMRGGTVIESSIEEILSRYLSRANINPSLLGSKFDAFKTRARELLASATSTGRFAEGVRPAQVNIWTPPART